MNVFQKFLILGVVLLLVGTNLTSLVGSIISEDQTHVVIIDDTELSDLRIIINGTWGENGWFISCVTITIITEGESIIWYRLDGGHWMGPYESSVELEVREDGEHIIHARSIDPWGNQSNAQAEFKIDQTDPTIELTAENIGNNTWLITAHVYDETSGVAKVEFYVNGEYLGEVTEYPYEWIYNYSPPTRLSVKGLIFNPKITEETVSFFAIILIGRSAFNNPIAQAIAYDNAGNQGMNPVPNPPIYTDYYFYIFEQLTFQNDYSGHIGAFFINAVFEDGPV